MRRVLAPLAVLGFALAAAGCDEEEGVPPAPGDAAARQAAEAERTGFPVEVANDLDMRFRLVPATAYAMGSPPQEAGREEGEALHEVHLVRPYYLQATEVTNAQYRQFRPEHRSGRHEGGAEVDSDPLPVVRVSHADAVAFAAWLTERDPRFVYRLPTEAEWEHACRAGAIGPAGAGIGELTTCAGGRPPAGAPSAEGPSPAASLPANAWGLSGMHGNVAEWCHDRFGPYPLWRVDNPQGAARGRQRVVRGGSWADPVERLRCAARAHLPADRRAATVGIRLAFSLGYGRTEYGRYRVTVRTIDPTVPEGEARGRPGWPIYMISVVDRLTDRANQIPDPRWTHLKRPSPVVLNLAPGVYYVFSYRMEGGRRVRSIEMKFSVPGPSEVLCPIPRPYQSNPQ